MTSDIETDFYDIELSEDSISNRTEYLSAVFSYILSKKKILEMSQEREFEESNVKDDEIDLIRKALPRLQLNVNKIGLVNFSADLVYGLNLTIGYRSIIGLKYITFESDVTYNEDEGQKLRRFIIGKKGFIYPDENYFNLNENLVTKGTKVTTLINTRVLLFWRGIEINEITVKRILSLGLLFLIKKISYPELFFEINSLLPNGRYNVSIKYVDNSYVLIGIELPIF